MFHKGFWFYLCSLFFLSPAFADDATKSEENILEEPSECNLNQSQQKVSEDDFCAFKIHQKKGVTLFSADAVHGGALKMNSQIWAKRLGGYLPEWSNPPLLTFSIEGTYQTTIASTQLYEASENATSLQPISFTNYTPNEALKDPMYQFITTPGSSLLITVDTTEPTLRKLSHKTSRQFITERSTVVVLSALKSSSATNLECGFQSGDIVTGFVMKKNINQKGYKNVMMLYLTKDIARPSQKQSQQQQISGYGCLKNNFVTIQADHFKRLL